MNSNSIIDKLSAGAGRIGRQRHLGAIRDGFITLMPLMIVGSLVTLINNFPIGTGSNPDRQYLKQILAEHDATKWLTELFGDVWWGTFGMLSLFAVITIAYYLAKSYDSDRLTAAVVALGSFMSAVPQVITLTSESGEAVGGWGLINYKYVNASGLFVAIIIALVSTEIFIRLSRSKKLVIKMPDGVPPAVSKSFAALVPGMLTVIIVTFLTGMIKVFFENNIFDLIADTILKPLNTASGSLGFGLVIVLLTHVLWAFGIHGPNIFEGLLQPLNAMAIERNQALIAEGVTKITDGFVVFNKSFVDAFVYMGGSGVALGLIIAILLLSKSKQNRMVARLGAAPAIFNISEPVIFGLPIVLNPIFIVPFILGPVICLLVAYGATMIGFLPVVRAIIPWTTPPILSGLFATGFAWQGPVIQVINLAISILLYIPFVKIADRIEARKEQNQA